MSAQKIDNIRLKSFAMIIALFEVDDKDRKFSFFEERFLPANINMNVNFGILFLTLINVKVNLNNQKRRYRLYHANKANVSIRRYIWLEKKSF